MSLLKSIILNVPKSKDIFWKQTDQNEQELSEVAT